jgi:hypothetical protein
VIRARTLARTLRSAVGISLRGGAAAQACAKRLALPVVGGAFAPALDALRPALVVIDDPHQASAARALAAARRRGIPVASIHDLGLSIIESDLVIDGSIAPPRLRGRPACLGPRFALLDLASDATSGPQPRSWQAAVGRRRTPRVFIALGGGPRVYLASALARAIAASVPGASIRIAAGLAGSARDRRSIPDGGGLVTWLGPLRTLVPELRACDVAIVAGGVTLYEACALGTPVIAVPVVAAQEATIRAFGRENAVLHAGVVRPRGTNRVARMVVRHVEDVLGNPAAARRRTATARRLVDGLGARRVADALERLARCGTRTESA